METQVIMKRELFGQEISQKSKSEFFSATDLIKAGNKWRINNGFEPFLFNEFLRRKNTIEFINSLKKEFGQVIITRKGRGSSTNHTWVHPYLFIDIALAINPELKIQVYSWLFDKLIEYRNNSGDSYKLMCGALYSRQKNKSLFFEYIRTVAKRIQEVCKVDNWQKANENQLKLRDEIHKCIYYLSDIMRNNDNIVEISIEKAKKQFNIKDVN